MTQPFHDSVWDGSPSRWPDTASYCMDCLISVWKEAGRSGPVQSHCFLPFRAPGAKRPNKNALKAIGGAHGVGAVKKPVDVPQGVWDGKVQQAARRLAGWWPQAFGKPAPDHVLSLAEPGKRAKLSNTSTMVAFFLPEVIAEGLALPDGEKAEDLHLTLVYLGEISDERAINAIGEILEGWASVSPRIKGELSGMIRFEGEGDVDPVCVHFDASGLPEWRQELVERLEGAGFALDKSHGFTPHVTLRCIPKGEELALRIDPVEVIFDQVTLVWGRDRFNYDLSTEVKMSESLCERKAIKILDKSTRRIGSYATAWDEVDCEGDRMQRGAIERYVGKFTPMMFYLHGLDPQIGPAPVGTWDGRSFKLDEEGLWVEGNVGFDEYGDIVWKRLEAKGEVGLSLGSLFYLVKRQVLPDGTKAVVDWPPVEISIMEGGRQCVATARSAIKVDQLNLLGIKGRRLIELLERGIRELVDKNDSWERPDAVAALAQAAGIEPGTQNQILNGSIDDPPDERLQGWSKITSISMEQFRRARDADLGRESKSVDQAGSSEDPADKYIQLLLSGRKAKEESAMSTQDVDVLVQERLDKLLAEREAAEQAERKRKAELEAAVDGAVKARSEEADAQLVALREQNEQLEAEINQLKVGLAAAKSDGTPSGPVVGMNYQPDGRITIPANFLRGVSPYDRLDTFDLALRFEVMRSYGKQPSVKFWRALALRAVKMAREEDTVYIKNGQPLKKPALDFEALVPRGLSDVEVEDDESSLSIKSDHRLHKGGFDATGDVVTALGIKQLVEIAVKSDELIYSTQSGFGDEWVPTLMSADLWRTIRLEAMVLPLFRQFDMPSQPFNYPIESTDPTLYSVGEATDETQLVLTGGPFTDSKVATGNIAFSAGKLGAISYWSEEQEEDSIIIVEPQFRDQYGLTFAHGIDEVLISGDESTGSANISFDGSSIGATSRFLVVDGLRHRPLITTSTDGRDGGTLTIDDFGSTQSLMGTGGKFGVNPRDLAFISDTGVWHKAKLLSEVLTLDHFGSAATILTGQLGSLFGVPLIISEDYGLTDTAGKVSATGSNNTKGSFMCVNRRGIMVGWRRRPRVRVVGLPGADARYIVGSARFDIGFKEAGMVALSYNIGI